MEVQDSIYLEKNGAKNLAKEKGQAIKIVCFHTKAFQVYLLVFNCFNIMNQKYYYEEKSS